MRVIRKQESQLTCHRCKSVIGILPHEFHTVGPPGPYDMDYEPSEIGKSYWYCPVCKEMNWCASSSTEDDTY